jgi:hypothetical protein
VVAPFGKSSSSACCTIGGRFGRQRARTCVDDRSRRVAIAAPSPLSRRAYGSDVKSYGFMHYGMRSLQG